MCVCVCTCVCVCVRVSVRLSTVFLGNRGNSERETWTYICILSSRRHARENKILERKKPGKLVKRTAAEVSVRQIEIADDRCT